MSDKKLTFEEWLLMYTMDIENWGATIKQDTPEDEELILVGNKEGAWFFMFRKDDNVRFDDNTRYVNKSLYIWQPLTDFKYWVDIRDLKLIRNKIPKKKI